MLTAPRPPAHATERVGPIGPEVYLMPRVIKVCTLTFLTSREDTHYHAQTCFFLAGTAEVLSILANLYPRTVFSTLVDVTLIRTAPPAHIAITWPFLVAWICCMFGTFIRRQCYDALGDSFTFEISLQKDHKLVTSGPYAYVRHPSYSSGALGLFGALTCHTTPGAWLAECSGLLQPPWARPLIALGWLGATAVFVLAIVPRLSREDAIMRDRFGGQWDAWAKRVPCKLIPGIY